ncbi:hypothetical protein [Sulfuricurvum sp.]|uniref:hypothetical protein n=1 Tax=Sulfuricurvum sp. TaxID=2025608 RepID=UPI0025DC6742|nr:hypothetical protein [Sulfuricurvum sp.]
MKKIILVLFCAAALWGFGDGAIYWAPHGCDNGKATAAKHGSHGKGESAMFALMNQEGNASAHLILPDLSEKPLTFKAATVNLPKPSMGGYYAMVAEGNEMNMTYSAVRYLSLQGRPAKVSPTKLTALPKTDLEIIPDPLHREHDRYTASKSYRFLLHFKGKPLINTTVTLETHDTPVQTYTSDKTGAFLITLPNDFKNVKVGRSENKPSEFLLSTQYRFGEHLYKSTLTMPYSLNPNDFWQSQSYGAITIFIGFLVGLVFYRRIKKGAKNG